MTSKNHRQIYYKSELLFYQDLQKERSEAFTCLYLQTYQLCLPYALGKGSCQEESEDLLQECLAIFVEKLRNGNFVFQEGAKITTYFYRIYINQWKKAFEKKTKRGEVRLQMNADIELDEDETYQHKLGSLISIFKVNEEDDEGKILKITDESIYKDYDEDERTWIFKKLKHCFSLLGEDCQNMLQWYYVEDLKLKQIAEALKITEASATVKRFKCAKYLKEKFRLV